MREFTQWFGVLVFLIDIVACGYPHLPVLSDGPSIDVPSSDVPQVDVLQVDVPNVDAAPAPSFLSCTELTMTCGANSNDSCCDSLEVPSGSYYRSFDLAGDGQSGTTSNPATLSNFRLDKYKVTVGRFRAFVNAGMGTQMNPPVPGSGAHAKVTGSGWDPTWNASLAANTTALVAAVKCDSQYQTWTDMPAANEHRPMNCITWYEAMAFCVWDGGYLPTEAEWNYAAGGGDQQRAYPWSNPAGALTPLDSAHASYFNGTDCVGDGMPGCAVTDLAAVGTKPMGDGRWGQSDLAGNVWEWILDWYANYAEPCIDCANLAGASSRVLRGGSFDSDATFLRVGRRYNDIPVIRHIDLGVRCARMP